MLTDCGSTRNYQERTEQKKLPQSMRMILPTRKTMQGLIEKNGGLWSVGKSTCREQRTACFILKIFLFIHSFNPYSMRDQTDSYAIAQQKQQEKEE